MHEMQSVPTMSQLVSWLSRGSDPTLRSAGFMDCVRGAVASAFGDDEPTRSTLLERIDQNRVVPDLCRLLTDERELHAIEIEDTHELTVRKLTRYYNLLWALDAARWRLRVFVVDRYGANRREVPVLQLGLSLVLMTE